MSQRSRFCVLFSDVEDSRPPKTRLLHSDSSREDLIHIWKQIYKDEKDPVGAELIIHDSCVYKLDDDDDIVAFLAQAEDQYKILPSRPLYVKLVDAKRREMQARIQMQGVSTSPKVTVSEGKLVKQFPVNVNSNNNNERNLGPGSPENTENSPAPYPLRGPSEGRDPLAPWPTNPDAFMSLYSKYRQHSSSEATRLATAVPEKEKKTHQTVATAITSIAGTSFMQSPSSRSPDVNSGYGEGGDAHFGNSGPLKPFVKQFADVRHRTSGPIAPNMARDEDAHAKRNRAESFLPPPGYGLTSAYSAFINNLQEQSRAEQSNRQQASYLIQTFLNQQALANAQRPDQDSTRPRANLQFHDQSPVADGYTPASRSVTANGPPAFHPMHTARSSALLSSLAEYNNNNSFLAAYMNTPAFQALQNRADLAENPEDSSKKPKSKKRKREDGKLHDGTKRIRSSVDQSNIEFHYERAQEFNAMDESEQKLQNSAHRSHWKHLLFVAGISPNYMRQFKHAKYDEWSSEARDIFAMCQPERYMWSFLTLSKQGDLLCKRIMARIEGLMNKKKEDRPDWCPPDDILQQAHDRAKDRLSQLQRIMYSRSLNNREPTNSGKGRKQRELDQDQSTTLVETYQHEEPVLLEQSQSVVHAAAPARTLPSSMFAGTSGARSSSVTSSPISMASPVLEEPCTSGSGRSDSSSPAEHQNGTSAMSKAGCSRQADRRCEASEDHSHSQDFVADSKEAISSPRKWVSSGMGQVAEHA